MPLNSDMNHSQMPKTAAFLDGLLSKLAMDDEGGTDTMLPAENKGSEKDEKKKLAKKRAKLSDQMRGAHTTNTESADEDGNTE